jgi:hypothetical protein
LVDLDADGNLELISGSWPGEIFVFWGGPGRTFAKPEMLKDKSGEYVNVGGGIKEQSDGQILITGNAEFESTESGTVVVYHGKRLEAGEGKSFAITGTASAVYAADWDSDGDQDLLVGYIGGDLYQLVNEGSPKEPSFAPPVAMAAAGQPIRVDGDAGPTCADWDADGDLDLLVGDGEGKVTWFRNDGERGRPKLAKGSILVPEGEVKYGKDAAPEPRRGQRAKICATDWNGDGRLDLLLGDISTQRPAPQPTTPEAAAEQAALRQELETSMRRYGELFEKLHGPGSKKSPSEERARLEEEFEQVQARVHELNAQLPREYDMHGWVWYFERKAPLREGG